MLEDQLEQGATRGNPEFSRTVHGFAYVRFVAAKVYMAVDEDQPTVREQLLLRAYHVSWENERCG